MNGLDRKITYLRNLIANPGTEAEGATAQRMLNRLLAKAARHQGAPGGASDRRTYGRKYDQTKGKSLTDIAKLIRQDIKLATKAARAVHKPGDLAVADPVATLPHGLKISVRTRYFSGGGAIDIIIRHIPHAWGWVPQETVHWHKGQTPSPALKALAEELKDIHRAYNHDGSDIMTDYFDVRFYGNVSDDNGRTLA